MTAAEREARILGLEPVVKAIALARFRALARRVPLDDLISAGWRGAIDAVDRRDPTRQNAFSAYAGWRIRGEIQDYLRTIDPLSRDHRRAVKRAQSEAVERDGVLPSEGMTISLDYHRDEFREDWGAQIRDPRPLVDQVMLERAALNDAQMRVATIFKRAQLNPRTQKILMLWMAGHRQKAIARAFGFNESRASQICNRAIAQLRAAA